MRWRSPWHLLKVALLGVTPRREPVIALVVEALAPACQPLDCLSPRVAGVTDDLPVRLWCSRAHAVAATFRRLDRADVPTAPLFRWPVKRTLADARSASSVRLPLEAVMVRADHPVAGPARAGRRTLMRLDVRIRVDSLPRVGGEPAGTVTGAVLGAVSVALSTMPLLGSARWGLAVAPRADLPTRRDVPRITPVDVLVASVLHMEKLSGAVGVHARSSESHPVVAACYCAVASPAVGALRLHCIPLTGVPSGSGRRQVPTAGAITLVRSRSEPLAANRATSNVSFVLGAALSSAPAFARVEIRAFRRLPNALSASATSALVTVAQSVLSWRTEHGVSVPGEPLLVRVRFQRALGAGSPMHRRVPLHARRVVPIHPQGCRPRRGVYREQLVHHLVAQHERVVGAIRHGECYLGRLAEIRAELDGDLLIFAALRDDLPSASAATEYVWRHTPGAAVLLLVRSALHLYDHPMFWEPLHEATGLFDRRDQATWGRRFKLFARLHRLPLTGGAARGARRYVAPILHQAGVPTNSLPALFMALEEAGAKGHAELELAAGYWPRGLETRVGHTVAGFIEDRSEEARQWLSELMRLLDCWRQGRPAPDAPNLPDRVREAFVSWCEQEELDDYRGERRAPVVLALSRTGRPVIRVPEIADAAILDGRTVLTIAVDAGDAAPRRVRVAIGRRGRAAFVPARDIDVAPSASYRVALEDTEGRVLQRWTVVGLPDDGLAMGLPFCDGVARSSSSLPASVLDIVFSRDAEIEVLGKGGEPIPPRVAPRDLDGLWTGFRLVEVDLADGLSVVLRATGSGRLLGERRWTVGGRTRIELAGGTRLREGPPGPHLYSRLPETVVVSSPPRPDAARVALRLQRRGDGRWVTIPLRRERLLPGSPVSLSTYFRAREDAFGMFRVDVGGPEFVRFDIVRDLEWKWSWGKRAFYLSLTKGVFASHLGVRLERPYMVNPGVDGRGDIAIVSLYKEDDLAGPVDVVLRYPRWALVDRDSGDTSPEWASDAPEVELQDVLRMREPVIWFEPGDASRDDLKVRLGSPDDDNAVSLWPTRLGRQERWEYALFRQRDTLRANGSLGTTVELEAASVKLLEVAREWRCRLCSTTLRGRREATEHAAKHLDRVIGLLQQEVNDWDSYLSLGREKGHQDGVTLPDRITVCHYCDRYFEERGYHRSTTTKLIHHQMHECSAAEKSDVYGTVVVQIDVVTDVRKIRERLYPQLVKRHSCKRCGRLLERYEPGGAPATDRVLREHEACIMQEVYEA